MQAYSNTPRFEQFSLQSYSLTMYLNRPQHQNESFELVVSINSKNFLLTTAIFIRVIVAIQLSIASEVAIYTIVNSKNSGRLTLVFVFVTIHVNRFACEEIDLENRGLTRLKSALQIN